MDNFADNNADATMNKYTGPDGDTEWFKGTSGNVTATGWKNYKINDGGGNWWCRPSWTPNGAINQVNVFHKQGSEYGDYWMEFTMSGYYTYNTKNPSGTADAQSDVAILYTSATPVTISTVSNKYASVSSVETNIIYVHLNKNKCSEERVLIRYTTNNWSSSTLIEATNINLSNYCTGIFIGHAATVSYYALTVSTLNSDVSNKTDLMTLAFNNNTGNNYTYSVVQRTPHTIVIDGANDFTTNEVFITTSSGYTNWLTWDANYLYIGYYGADISAGDVNKTLLVYLSTNTNTGTAYGVNYTSQQPVLPFKADFIFNFHSSYAWDSAVWGGTAWNWNTPFTVNSGSDLNRSGNYLEFRISKTQLGNTPFLDVYIQFILRTAGSEWTYGAVPYNSLSDGYDSNPSNFISFSTNIWQQNIVVNSTAYRTNDNVIPYTNVLLSPTNNASIRKEFGLTLTNYADDDVGIYKIEFYTNTGGLYHTVYCSNSNRTYTYDLPANSLSGGTHRFYTIAYDTKNQRTSTSNAITVIVNSPPQAPTLLNPANNDIHYYSRRPKFKWSIPADANGDILTNFQIIISANSDLSSPVENATTKTTNYQCGAYLNVSTTYYWCVRAHDGIEWGAYSTTNQFKIDPSSITVDTSIAEWGNTTFSGGNNTDQITNGQWQWKDDPNDRRTDIAPHEHAEIEEFRISGDTNVLFFMFKVNTLGPIPMTYVSIGVDTNTDNSANGFLELREADCHVNPDSPIEWEIIANIDRTGLMNTSMDFNDCGENWFTASTTPGYGEIAIPWEEFNFGNVPEKLRFYVSFGLKQGGEGNWGIADISTFPDFLDVITTNGTWTEVSGGTNRFYFDVNFGTNGKVIQNRFEVVAPATATAGVPFNITVKALTYLGGKVLDFNRDLIYSLSTNGNIIYLSNSGWVGGETTATIVINSIGSNKIGVKDAYYTNTSGQSAWIVMTRPSIHINEVCYDPLGANSDGQWIEIYNAGATNIYITNWCFYDGDAGFPKHTINQNIILQAGHFLVLQDGSGTDDTDFSDGRGLLYGEWGSGILGGADTVGLYCHSSSATKYSLIDFMGYGNNAGTKDDLAVSVGLWTDGAFASTNGCREGGSLILLPDGNDNNLASDWHPDNTPTKKYPNTSMVGDNFTITTQTNGGYQNSIVLGFALAITDPQNDLVAGDAISNIIITLGGTIQTNEIIEARLYNDNGAGQLNYGYKNNNKTNNLLMGAGIYSNAINAFVFNNLSNCVIPSDSNILVYFTIKLSTNAVPLNTLHPSIQNNHLVLASSYPNPIGPADVSLSNGQNLSVKSGRFVVNEYTDAVWSAEAYKYQFIELYNNSDVNLNPVSLGWNISTASGSDTLSFYRGSAFNGGDLLLLIGGTFASTLTNFYLENPQSPILITPDAFIGGSGLIAADRPFILREGNTLLSIIDYTNSYTTATNTVERINPYGGDTALNFQASSITNGTPGYLNGFRAAEMNLQNVTNYVLENGSYSNLALSFFVPSDNGNIHNITLITISNNGTAVDTDVSFKLFKDGGSAGFDGDETLVGAFVYQNNSRWLWSGSTSIGNAGQRLFVLADIPSDTSDGRTVRLSIERLLPSNPTNYNGVFTNGVSADSYNDGPVDYIISNTDYQICGVPSLSIVKTIESIDVGFTNAPLPGALVLYKITYQNLGYGLAKNVVIYDQLPQNTTFYTNYMGTATGWEVQYSSIADPDQSYNSADYTADKSGARWVRFRKAVVHADEDGRTIFIGVTID